jgi:hypothetical protein
MPSIILSFVGQQDPVSDNTREDGSIVSLLRHLVAQQNPIQQIILLYTTGPRGTQDRAELTQGWLTDAPFQLSEDAITLIPVSSDLSDDPVNLWLAVQAARQGLDTAMAYCTAQDRLELNASSGTPVMKSAWGILQAAGYAPKSRLWQVRNPKEQQAHQDRVFETNIQVLRQEFDVRVIKQQLQDYNYNGALTTLNAAGLVTPYARALLTYGHCRLSLDFRGARATIIPAMDDRWNEEITRLLEKHSQALLREAYFNAVVELKNQKFSDALVRVFQFQEQALQYFVNQHLANRPKLPNSFDDTRNFWADLPRQHSALYQFLQKYRFKGEPLKLERFPHRPVLLAILEFSQSPAIALLETLNAYCEQRNYYIHRFEGISALEDAPTILKTMRQVLEMLGQTDFSNPFNDLNQAVVNELEGVLHKNG